MTEPKGTIRFQSGYCVLMNILRGSYQVGPCARKDMQDGLNFVCKKTNSLICPTIDHGKLDQRTCILNHFYCLGGAVVVYATAVPKA